MSAKYGRKANYSREDVALAYELRQEGCSWKLIGYGIGCGSDAIRKAVRSAEQRGIQ